MTNRTDKSLKKRNQPQLIIFLSLNVVLLGVFMVGSERFSTMVHTVVKGDLATLTKAVALPAVAGLLLGILSWMIPKAWKETLIFWRFGARRLPSSEAFTKIAPADLRIDMVELSARLGELPTDHQKQSTLWYATYRKHCKEAPVEDANGAYLLYREMTALVPLVIIALLIVGPALHVLWSTLLLALIGLAIEFFLVMLAARNAGTRLVSNVLALEGARPHKSEPKAEKKPRAPRKATVPQDPPPPAAKKSASGS